MLWKEKERLEVIDGVLYRRIEQNDKVRRQLIVPKSLRAYILFELHDELGHQRIQRTLTLVSDRFYWIGMWMEVSDYCKSCKCCKLNKSARVNLSMGSLRAQKSLEIIAIELITIEKSDKGIETFQNAILFTIPIYNSLPYRIYPLSIQIRIVSPIQDRDPAHHCV